MELYREGKIIRFAVSYMMYLFGNKIAIRTNHPTHWEEILVPAEVHHVFRSNNGEATVEIPIAAEFDERQTLVGLASNVEVTFYIGGERVIFLVDAEKAKVLRMMGKK